MAMFILQGAVRRTAAIPLGFAACLYAAQLSAETADERLERLESEIRELRELLHEQRKTPAAAPLPAAVPGPAAAAQPSGAVVRYYLQSAPLGEIPPAGARPAAAGRISDLETLAFDPAAYDVPDAGLFSDYRDPASYPYVGLLLEGALPVVQGGEYELVVYPKPAREGGANVATRLSVQLSVDDTTVLEFTGQTSWQPRRGRMRLEPGLRQLRLWAVAASPGFGPSPTASQMVLAIKGPGDAAPRPLHELQVPAAVNTSP